MSQKEQERITIFARGFVGAYLDAEFDADHRAEMSSATYKKLLSDFPGADIQIVEEKENGR